MDVLAFLAAMVAIPLAILILVQIVVTSLDGASARVRLGSARFASLDAFVGAFGESLGLPGVASATDPRPESARFAGVLRSGRSATVEFASPAWRAPVVSRTGVELEPGEVWRARRLVARGDAARALGVPGVERLELRPRTGVRAGALGKPVLELVAVVSEERTSGEHLRSVLEALDSFVSSSDLPPLKLSESGSAQRCALCHGDLDEALVPSPAVASCDGCGTVLHEACWLDLGRCPALHCPGHALLSEGGDRAKVTA